MHQALIVQVGIKHQAFMHQALVVQVSIMHQAVGVQMRKLHCVIIRRASCIRH
jgi:hypothetical protein